MLREKDSPCTELRMQMPGPLGSEETKARRLYLPGFGEDTEEKGFPSRVRQIWVWGEGKERSQMWIPKPLLRLQKGLVLVLAGS